MEPLPGYVVPGQLIAPSSAPILSGFGTEVSSSGVRATLLGEVVLSPIRDAAGKQTVSVHSRFTNGNRDIETSSQSGNSARAYSRLPQVGNVVYAKVLRITARDATVEILSVENDRPLVSDHGLGIMASQTTAPRITASTVSNLSEIGEGYGALIRSQDVRATERDKVKMEEMFRPGDIIRASVLSIGDGTHYYLSTIRNDLGVVFAKSRTGNELKPRDWQSMEDSNGLIEPRKCANPFI